MGHKVRILRNSRYAPIRYEATRPYASRFGKLYVSQAEKGDTARLQFIRHELIPLIKAEVLKMGTPDGPGPVQGEMVNVQVYGSYQKGGRLIFDLRSELSKSLLVTDSKYIPCEALTFPAQAFYLHFGKGTGLVDSGMEIEGAFIQHWADQKAMLVDLVQTGAFSMKEFWLLPMGEQMTGVRIDLHDSMPIMDALDASLDEIIERNRELFKQMEEMERDLAVRYGQPIKVPSPVEDLGSKREILHRSLQLIVNTLFFLNAEASDVQDDWEEEAPRELISQLSAEKFGTRKTAENHLSNQGYVKVKFIGRHYAKSAESQAVAQLLGSSGKSMSTHLRRGHFRNQPYGPERMLRKTVFIAPTVINAGKGDPAGRIYETQ